MSNAGPSLFTRIVAGVVTTAQTIFHVHAHMLAHLLGGKLTEGSLGSQ